MKGSPPAVSPAYSLQNLFAVEDEFEDEDFLSAVVDTENQFSSSLSVNPGCLKPMYSEPKAAKQALTLGQLTSCSTLPPGASSLSAQGLRLSSPSVSTAGGDSPSKTSTCLRYSPSPSLAGGTKDQSSVTSGGVTTEPHALFSLGKQHPGPASGILQTPIVTNHLVQLVTATNRTPGMPAHLPTRAKTRRFPGPAGLLPHQHSGKNLEEIMISTPQIPAHGALAKFRTEEVLSSQPSGEDFERGPWLTMKAELGLDDQDPACFLHTYSIVMVLRKAALKQLPRNKVPTMAVMIKSLSRNTVDASVVFRDPTGEMQGTVHRLLLEERQNELKTGSVLLLKQIGVFSPSLRNHYLNVTPNNLVQIYSPDSGDGRIPRSSQPLSKLSSPLQSDSLSQPPGPESSFHALHCDEKPREKLRTSSMEPASREELPEADDLDGLLGELPEDFFSEDSGW
ncbi:homologous recombination OB-fold protein isoform 2-T2 [Sarcophilus harrisii]